MVPSILADWGADYEEANGKLGREEKRKKCRGVPPSPSRITELHVHGDADHHQKWRQIHTFVVDSLLHRGRERGGVGGGQALEDGEGGRGGDQYWAQEVKAYTGNRARERLRTFSFPERSPSSLSLASFCSWDGCYSSPPPVRQACQTRSQTNSSDSAGEASLVYHSVHHQKAIGSFSTVKWSSGPECC